MPGPTQLDRVTMVVLRYMRRPLFALVFVYAVGIIGMALIPGQDAEGNPESMSLFHAFYFFTYTATTTGFGEIPHTFTDEQRLWAIFCLYTGVIAWFYAIGSVIHLVQNPHFVNALNEYRFARQIRYVRDPFFILCGFGDTGSLLARGLSDHHLGAVVIDPDPERIKALALRDYTVKMPGLCADASVPKHLVDAGVRRSNCRAVIALAGDDEVNRKVAVVTRFLNPDVHVLVRSTSARHEEHLRSVSDVTVIDAFEVFAQLVCMAIATPWVHNLNGWLVGARGFRLGYPLHVPDGDWILCGYGRMGRWLDRYLGNQGLRVVVIDPGVDESDGSGRFIRSHADREALARAGIDRAAGIVAGTNRDSDNLGVLMSARQANPDIFCIARQNSHENQPAFDAAQADLTLQHSLTTARRVLKHLISPLTQELIDYLCSRDPAETRHLVGRLHAALGEARPHLWRVIVGPDETAALVEALDRGTAVSLRDLLRDPEDRRQSIACVPLGVRRGDETLLVPETGATVQHGDELVLCSTEGAEHLLRATLNNPYTLEYLVTGVDPPRGHVFVWLERRLGRRRTRAVVD